MGLLRFTIHILLTALLIFTGCANSIALKDARLNDKGIMTYGLNEQRNFHINENLNIDALEVLWENETRGSFGNFSVTIYDNFVFVPDLSGRVYVFDNETGKEIGYQGKDGDMPVTINIKNNKIYYFVNNAQERYFSLYIFNYKFGTILDEIKIRGKCSNEPLQLEDGLVILTEQGRLLKIDFLGSKIWEYDSKEISISNPVFSNNNIYWATVNGNLISVNAANGRLNYKNKITVNRIEAGITINGDHGFVGDVEGILYKIDMKEGKIKNEITLESKIKSNPVLNDSKLFIGDMSGMVYAIDFDKMEINWIASVEGVINTTALLFNNVLVQPNLNRKVHFINVDNGTIEKEFEYDRRVKMTPVFFNDRLYIGIDRGTLFAYKTK